MRGAAFRQDDGAPPHAPIVLVLTRTLILQGEVAELGEGVGVQVTPVVVGQPTVWQVTTPRASKSSSHDQPDMG